jgi:general secretion pathway protein G
MNSSRNAFTMIEIVFVIVILGILSAIAIPKFAATRDDAEVAKILGDVHAVRSAIMSERQSRLVRGEVNFITALDQGVGANTSDVAIFDGDGTSILLPYPVYTSVQAAGVPTSGAWIKTGVNQYAANAGGSVVVFTYVPATGIFDCDHTKASCRNLLH